MRVDNGSSASLSGGNQQKILIARSGSREPRSAPAQMASASAATIPAVEPSHVPIGSSVVAPLERAGEVANQADQRTAELEGMLEEMGS